MPIAYCARTVDLGHAGTLSRSGGKTVTWNREPLGRSSCAWDNVPRGVHIRLYPIGIGIGMGGVKRGGRMGRRRQPLPGFHLRSWHRDFKYTLLELRNWAPKRSIPFPRSRPPRPMSTGGMLYLLINGCDLVVQLIAHMAFFQRSVQNGWHLCTVTV